MKTFTVRSGLSTSRYSHAAAVALCITLGVISHAQLLNGDFTQVGVNGNPVTSGPNTYGPTAVESAAAHWFQFNPNTDGTVTSELVTGFGPGGTNALHFFTTTGYSGSLSFGSGIGQIFGNYSWARYQADLLVVAGTVTGGLISTSGPFFDFTGHGVTGNWIHLDQTVASETASVAYENLTYAPVDFYIANATLETQSVPEPCTLGILGMSLMGFAARRKAVALG